MAEAENQKGNALYKAGKYDDARQCFTEASKLDKTEPKYPSNLSAVLYEQAYYPECILPIYLAWGRLMAQNQRDGAPSTPPQSDPLAIKLATRFAKANTYGVAGKLISLHAVKTEDQYANIREDITKFAERKRENAEDTKIQEMNAAWSQWHAVRKNCAQHSEENCSLTISEAQKRVRTLNIFKSSFISSKEYFRFGHDSVQSLLLGLNGNPEDEHCLEFNIEKENWAFLFGGSGDARHVFGTLIHISETARIFNTLKKTDTGVSVHMTLIDTHPATLARVIVVFSLIHQILRARVTKDNAKKVELHATLFYVYTTMLMPSYCRQIVMDTCADLVKNITDGSSSLFKCLHIHEQSVPAILEFLKYWSAPLPKSTQTLIQRNDEPQNQIFSGPESSLSKSLRDNLITLSSKGPYNDPDVEMKIYKRSKILLPPKSLLSRHPALAGLVKSYRSASNAEYMAVLSEVKNTWYPNPTLFDKPSEKPESAPGGSYPDIANNPFETLATLSDVIRDFQTGDPVPSSSGNSGFAASSGFFEMVADAIWELQDKLKIEMVVGDVITGVSKLFSGDLGERPKEFPTTYTRMFLSNVPDYTNGVLNTAVHLSHYLEPEELVVANCLLNTGVFRNISEFCYNYTLLLPDDLPRFLGCEILTPEKLAFDDIALLSIPLPRPLDELASKAELHRWLGHLLLCTLCNGTPRAQPGRIEFPNNINAFLHVLIHLHRVGFPAHWISEFLQSMVSNNLITTAQPYLDKTPIPSSEARNRIPATKIHLEAWQAEFQNIIASTLPATPFALNLPQDYPTYDELRTFKAAVRPLNLEQHPAVFRWGSLIYSGRNKTAGLLFYKPAQGIDAEFIARRIPGLFTGVKELRDIQVQIMLCPETFDLDGKNEVSWKMSQAWYDRMKKEKWCMAVYRTDIYINATVSVSVDEWSQIC